MYSPCSGVLKRAMWKDLMETRNKFTVGDWIIGGDFNSVKKRSERVGRSVGSNFSEIKDFLDFIDNSSLVDVSCKGKKFSWFIGDGISKSRIDRFLVSDNVVSSWGVVGQFIGSRDVSDHCPIWLEVDKTDWGSKSFKFNNEWFSHLDFLPFMKKEWESLEVRGRGDFILKGKFRIIKERCVGGMFQC